MEERPWTKSEFFAWSDGRRIVDLYELSKQLHCKQCSSLLDLRRTEREARYGLASVLYILCNCGVINDVHTGRTQQGHGNSPNPMYEVNIKASINLLMYGAGASRILSFLALLDIPVPHPDDTSLIVPVTEDAEMQSASPSVLPTTTTTATSPAQPNLTLPEQTPFQKPQPSSSFIPDPGFSSVPQPPPPEDDDDNEDALHIAENEDGEEVNDNQNDDNDDGDDEEYVPPSKVQSKPSQMSKRKSLLRGPKSARAKQAAKLAAQKRATKARIKVKIKKEKVETPKKAADEVAEVEVESGGKEFANPMEWSSSESDTESAGAKDSDASWHEEEEEDVKEEEEERPKRKRGRPKGSPDKAKRARKSGYKTKKEPVAKVKKGRVQGEAKDVPKCTACSKDFSSIKGYNVHMKRVHNQEMKANFEGGRKESVELCVDNSPPSPPHESCTQVKEQLNSLLFVCPKCSSAFASRGRLLQHARRSHPTADQIAFEGPLSTVPVRDAVSKTTVVYENGLAATHYQCQKCFKVYTSPYLISDHIRITNEGQLSCQAFCPSGRKLKRKTGGFVFDEEHCFVRLCQLCGKSFSSSQALYNHAARCKYKNSNEKTVNKFTCDVCGYSTGNCRDLLKHKQTHNPERTEPFVCDICGNAYFSFRGLGLHRNSVHFRTEVFPCPTCPKVFYSTLTQRRHIKTHTGEHSHACRVCGKAFTTSYNLKVHKRIHSGEKPYMCSHCKTQFAQKNSLNFHMKSCARFSATGNTGSVELSFSV